MFWPYLFLILAIASACLALAGVSPIAIFAVVSAACFMAFAGTALQTLRKFGM